MLSGLGVERSYSRPRVSNDNAFSESQFKTLKYAPSYPGRFADIEAAREWVASFMLEYQRRPHEGLAFYTPADVFHGRVDTVHQTRQAALDAHWSLHPQRYPNGPPQSKRPPIVVAINPKDGVNGQALLEHADGLVYSYETVHTSPKENLI